MSQYISDGRANTPLKRYEKTATRVFLGMSMVLKVDEEAQGGRKNRIEIRARFCEEKSRKTPTDKKLGNHPVDPGRS